jgi:SAM-dependent methyltransferase
MTSEPDDWQQRADELAAVSVAAGEPTAWFERLYAAGRAGSVTMPWDRASPNILLQEWASQRRLQGAGQRAVVVGAGLGADAAYLADLGYDTTAFDISPTAVAIASERVPRPDVHFEVADLLALPAVWLSGFDLVVEIYTVQALPRSLRAAATAAVGRLVAAGGTLLAIQAALGPEEDPNQGPPWPLTREEVEAFAAGGLNVVRIEQVGQDGSRFAGYWRAELTGP